MKNLSEYISYMKELHSLNEYLNERLIVNQRFDEKLIINKNYKYYTPASFNELREIIEQRYKEQGPGTEQKPINFNDIDVSKIDSFYNKDIDKGIFEITKFKYIDISDWDVSKVKDMSCMFYNCTQLKSVGDLSNWDVSNVQNMRGMFTWCGELKSAGNLSRWNISKVEHMYGAFNGAGITNIPSWYKE